MKITSLLLPALLLFSAVLAPAQEMNTAMKGDIQEMVAQGVTQNILRFQHMFREAFNTPAFVKQLEAALNEGESLSERKEELSVGESMVKELIGLGIESRDLDKPALLARIAELPEKEEEHLDEERMRELSERVMRVLEPRRTARRRAQEQARLAANAERPDVTTLSNGVQMKVLPGEDKLSEANHMMKESGNDYFTSHSSGTCSPEDMPKPISSVADEIPAGSVWVFWIPAEVRHDYAVTEGEGCVIEEDEDNDTMQKVIIWKDAPDATLTDRPDIEALLLESREE